MESEHFDHLVSRLGTAGTRRRLLRFSALPLAGGLAAFLIDDDEGVAKKKKHKRKRCKSKEEVCAGKCGSVTYKCNGKKKTVDCGSCKCDVCANGCDFTSVQAAIDAAEPGDTIKLCQETYTEDIEIDKDLTIVGTKPPEGIFGGTFLQGTGKNRVIVVHRGTVRLEELWITGGRGGIFNDGTLTLHRCAVVENTADYGGGGIWNHFDARLEMTDSSVMWNTAEESGGGGGGGIYNETGATLTMTDCVVNGNTSEGFGGGGIKNESYARLEMTDCTVSGNTISTWGGGIGNGGTLEMTNCTVTENTASTNGGGIYNSGTMTLEAGTTVTKNHANNGGGIVNSGQLGGTSTCTGGSSVSGNTPNDCVAVNGGSCDGC